MRETQWSYVAGAASRTVAAHGGVYGGFSEQASVPTDRLEPPAGGVVVILCCGEPLSLRPALHGGSPVRSSAFIAGLGAQAQLVGHCGVNECIEVRLPPLSAAALWGGATSELGRDPIDLQELRRLSIDGLLQELRATVSWPSRLAAVDRFLANGFARSTYRIAPRILAAWRVLERSRGQIAVHTLARSVGWSERQLIRQFHAHLGLSPKSASRRLRFSHALDMILTQPARELSAIAAQAGFSDQSYLTREVQTSSGLTPGVLRTARFEHLPGIPAAALLTAAAAPLA